LLNIRKLKQANPKKHEQMVTDLRKTLGVDR